MRRQLLPQAHMWSRHIVEGLEEDHPLPQALAVFIETGCLTCQRGQGLTQGQVDPFNQGGADREAQVRQAFRMPATRALGTATTSLAVSSVRGPTTAAIIRRHSGAQLI